MELRPYQAEAKAAVFEQWDKGTLKTLLVLPTGCGKTIVFAKVAEDCVRQGYRVLILAHRGELLEQAADKIKKSTNLGCATEKAEQTCLGSWFRITVGSVQSMQREKRLSQFSENYFNVIIIDEAHHCISDGYQKVLQHFPSAKVLGVTATPDRGDMRNLGEFFESLAYEYTLPKAIREGYLSPIKAMTIPLQLDLSGVSIQSGDFKAGDIATALDPYLHQIADEMMKYCRDRKTVVFLPLVKTSQKFKEILNEKGFKAAEVNGESKDRAEVLEAFDKGEYNVLCNSMLLTEGWDCPSVDCVIVLRPTKVRSLYSQMVGRGTRLCEGKSHLLSIKESEECVMSEVGGKVYPVHNNVFKFGTKGMDSVDGDMVMPADLENFAPTIDGTTEEWYAMDAEGWAKSAMTGKKLSFAFKGKRSVGDAGNDYIAGLAWKFGQDVMTKFEWTMTSGAKLACDVVVNVTTPGGGDTTNIDALEFEVTCYGKPTYTPVVAA